MQDEPQNESVMSFADISCSIPKEWRHESSGESADLSDNVLDAVSDSSSDQFEGVVGDDGLDLLPVDEDTADREEDFHPRRSGRIRMSPDFYDPTATRSVSADDDDASDSSDDLEEAVSNSCEEVDENGDMMGCYACMAASGRRAGKKRLDPDKPSDTWAMHPDNPEREYWVASKVKELTMLRDRGAMVLGHPGLPPTPTLWVHTRKPDRSFKSRIVCVGNREVFKFEGRHFLRQR
jgi:hypothetical protein